MAIDLVWSWIFLVTLIPMWRAESSKQVIQSQAMQSLYTTVEHGENITGKIKAEITITTELQCPLSCTIDEECTAYRFNATGEKNCALIIENSTRTIFVSSSEGHLYKMDECYSIPCQNGGTCIDGRLKFTCECPEHFGGRMCEIDCSQNLGCPVVHRSLDSEKDLQLMNGAQIVVGKVGNGVQTNRDQKEYIDLGALSISCFTRPETCGSEGAAISFWFNLDACGSYGGMVSSATADTSGFLVACESMTVTLHLFLEDEIRSERGTTDVSYNQWHHLVGTLNEVEGEERFKLCLDGGLYDTIDETDIRSLSTGSGRVLIGRAFINEDNAYTSLELDELLFYDHALQEQEVDALYQHYN